MVESYNCLRLDNSYVFQVEVYKNKNDNDDKKIFKIDGDEIPFEKLRVGQLANLISNNEDKLNPNSTEDDIKNLGGVFIKRQSKFIKYFQKTSESSLSSQLLLSSRKKDLSWKYKKPLSEPLLNNIRKGDGTTWCTGHLKTTRVFRVMERLEEEGYLRLYISLETIETDGKILFWTIFSDYLVRTAPEYIKDQIKLVMISLICFQEGGEKQVILFIDEYDIMYRANDETISSFLRIVRNVKARKEEYAIWSINIVGPFSILHLSSKEVTTSPFNVYRSFQTPNFTQEQVQFLFKEYANNH
ncbi:P-loop containing nucleoside triphosphate hydrolase protein [Rhizophagus irregularis DAOM 181602=DAOM 197198]|nr:P-loop containing nucleoside triphosphate hydrolase protein [Rhizophagus irregularis DAOM 181602=DAOM 197198]